MKPNSAPSTGSRTRLTEVSLTRRTWLGVASAGAAAAVLPASLRAQASYPSKAITLIVPNPPGGRTSWPASSPCRWPRHSVNLWSWKTAQVPVA